MRIFTTKWFTKWAAKEGLTDEALRTAVAEMEQGLIDASLGGYVYKKRVGVQGRGKRGGVRTLLAFKTDEKAFFIYGFAKSQRDNIGHQELKALKRLAAEILAYSDQALNKALKAGELREVANDG
jgi:hypothetical protein